MSIYTEEGKKRLTEKILENLKEACKQKCNSLYQESLWKATALLISQSGLNRMLLHRIAWSPVSKSVLNIFLNSTIVVLFFQVDMFTVEGMTTAVECWKWLITARPHLELRFLQEMISAWNHTVHRKLGLFSVDDPQTSPLAVHEGKEKHVIRSVTGDYRPL